MPMDKGPLRFPGITWLNKGIEKNRHRNSRHVFMMTGFSSSIYKKISRIYPEEWPFLIVKLC
jgi:hypothetical protein